MKYTTRLSLCAALIALSLASVGCSQQKNKKVAANTTDTPDAVIVEEVIIVDSEKPQEGSEPAAAPAEKAPADKDMPKSPAAEIDKSPHERAAGKVMLGSPELTAGIPGEGPLKAEELEAWLNNPANHEPLDFELPLGLATGAAQVQGVDKNPLTRAKIELGRQLYFDPRLSSDVKVSCASCHDPDEGFARHTQFGVGIRDQVGGRNAPISYNRILSGPQFWDGRAGTLEAQAIGPIANPIEMGHTHDACVECLKAVPGYAKQFNKIFGRFDIEAVGEALASFERAIVTQPSPFDFYERLRPFEGNEPDESDDAALYAKYKIALEGAKEHPLSESAKRGRDLYFSEKSSCSACHVGANLTDEKYHNIGIGMDKEKPDIGREEVSKDPKDHGAFKTPTVRNVAKSAPYMHDGSIGTLEEVVEWYAKGGHPNPSLSDKIKKLELSDQDKKDLVEFMKQGCSSDFPKVARGRLPE